MPDAAADAAEALGEPLAIEIVPFVPGRRPDDEIPYPGLGSSEEVAVLLEGAEDPACVLYTLSGAGRPEVSVQVSIPAAGWERREVAIERVSDERCRFVLHPERELGDELFTFEHRFSQQVDIDLLACWK